MLKPIPNIQEAFNIAAQDKRQRMVKLVVKSGNVVLQATGSYNESEFVAPEQNEYAASYNTYRPRGNIPFCTYCGQLGHTIQKCYRVHGYPPGAKTPTLGNQSTRSSFVTRNQNSYGPRPTFRPQSVLPQQRAVANVFAGMSAGSMPYLPPPAVTSTSLDIS